MWPHGPRGLRCPVGGGEAQCAHEILQLTLDRQMKRVFPWVDSPVMNTTFCSAPPEGCLEDKEEEKVAKEEGKFQRSCYVEQRRRKTVLSISLLNHWVFNDSRFAQLL